jgi:protein O-mannosyl-transferase
MLVFAILALTAILYIPVFKNQLTNWDDDLYILHNPYFKDLSPANLKSIFTHYYMGNYHPLTLILMAIDYHIGSIDPWPYHLTSLILHVCNTLLVYVFMKKLLALQTENSGPFSIAPFVTALLFGIHTFQVESVAWVSEQKNLLYTLFFLLSLIVYIRYLNYKSTRLYLLSLFLFVLSLLSKGMAVPLSVSIICIDYFAGRNLLSRRVIREKLPFLLLSLIFGYIAILAQHSERAIRTGNLYEWYNQVAIACYGFVQYLIKICYPYKLSAFYPYPAYTGALVPYGYYICIGMVVCLLFMLFHFLKQNRAIWFGTLFFLANISIVIQILPVGDAMMADRYIYVPSIGLFFIMAYYANVFWQQSMALRYITLVVLVLYVSVLGYKTWHRTGVWKNSFTLWNNAIVNYPENNDRGYMNRCDMYYDMGNYSGALHDYKEMLKMAPNNSKIYVGMGRVKRMLNDREGAMKDYDKALSLRQSYEGYLNRAVLKMDIKDFSGAMADLDKALHIDSTRTEPYNNKGIIAYDQGDYPTALKYFNRSIELDSHDSKAYSGRGLTRQAMNNTEGAMDDFNVAISLSPSYDWLLDRAVLKMALKDIPGALEDMDKATKINPLRHEAYFNKGYIYLEMGNIEKSISELDKAIDINKTLYEAYLYRAIAKYQLADYYGAIGDLNCSIQVKPNAVAFYYLGLSNMQMGRKEAGCSGLQQAIAMGNTYAQEKLKQYCK